MVIQYISLGVKPIYTSQDTMTTAMDMVAMRTTAEASAQGLSRHGDHLQYQVVDSTSWKPDFSNDFLKVHVSPKWLSIMVH